MALAAGNLYGGPFRACLNDTARLSQETRTALKAEFRRLLPEVEFLAACGSQPLTTAKITFLETGRAGPRVLGSTYRTEGTVLPVIEVYVGAVLGALNGRAHARLLGIALARVAAHEAVHFFEQKMDHEESGILRSAFSGMELAAGDASLFAWRGRGTD